MPDLTIGIPTFNRADYLRKALMAIRKDAGGRMNEIEVVVSDNASDDDTERVVRTFHGLCIRYYRNASNLGAFENVLKACERSVGTYVMLHSDDDSLCPGALSHLLDSMRLMPEIGVIASPLQVFEDDSPERPLGRLRFPGDTEDILLAKGSGALSALFLRACSLSGLVIRRDLLDIAGARKHVQSLYPQIYLVGYAAKQVDALYLAQPLMKVRLERVRRWSYAPDFMAGAVLYILNDLTRNEPWGREVYRKVVRKRILAAYGPLYSSRGRSWRSFVEVVRGLASVRDYRRSGLFWSLVLGVSVLGHRGIALIRQVWSGPVIDAVK